MIRPLHVLKQSLEYILNKYKRTNGYRYICDQLKAIRQDLTVSFKDLLFMLYMNHVFFKFGYFSFKVQMIQNEFTIQVYETHARIALENVSK